MTRGEWPSGKREVATTAHCDPVSRMKSNLPRGFLLLGVASALCLPVEGRAQAEPAAPIVEVRGAGVVELEPNYAELYFGARSPCRRS